MKVVSSECIILKHQDFRERDRLVTFLARDKGPMTGVARGARKLTARGVSTFEPLNRGTIFYVEKAGSDLVAIRKCDPMPPYPYLEADYNKFLLASYMAELAGLCRVQGADAEPFFLLLAGALEELYGAPAPMGLSLVRLGFELDFLTCMGLQPRWERCCICERPLMGRRHGRPFPLQTEKHQFDVSRGGPRCPECPAPEGNRSELSAGTLTFLAAWRDPGVAAKPQPTGNALRELENAVTRHLIHHLEREPRSLALLPPPEEVLKSEVRSR